MSAAKYESSKAFKSALAMITHIYGLTAALPPEEKSGLSAAMKKSITGVPPLIAQIWDTEDYAPAKKTADAAHALMRDCLAQAQIASHLSYLSRHQITDLRKRLMRVDSAIVSLLDELFEDVDDEPISLADAA